MKDETKEDDYFELTLTGPFATRIMLHKLKSLRSDIFCRALTIFKKLMFSQFLLILLGQNFFNK
jgi:hypothetical protein